MAYAVCVTFELRRDEHRQFLPLMVEQADTSLRDEPGCRQFDVWSDQDRPDQIFLYEIYEDREAFEAHLASDHYKNFDRSVAPLVSSKRVATFSTLVE